MPWWGWLLVALFAVGFVFDLLAKRRAKKRLAARFPDAVATYPELVELHEGDPLAHTGAVEQLVARPNQLVLCGLQRIAVGSPPKSDVEIPVERVTALEVLATVTDPGLIQKAAGIVLGNALLGPAGALLALKGQRSDIYLHIAHGHSAHGLEHIILKPHHTDAQVVARFVATTLASWGRPSPQ